MFLVSSLKCNPQRFTPTFPSKSFIVHALFLCLDPFELLFVQGVIQGIQLHPNAYGHPVVSVPFVIKTIIYLLNFLTIVSKIN